MWFSQNQFLAVLILSFCSELQANCCHVNGTSLLCSLKANESDNCDNLNAYPDEVNLLFNDIPQKLHEKLLFGSLADFTTEEIIKLPTNFLYFLPINKLGVLSGVNLGSLLITHENDIAIAKKILQSLLTNQQRTEFLNFLVPKVIANDKILDLIGETVYKWNFDVKDGKFQRLSNIYGYALARLWAPYVLTTTKPFSTRLLDMLAEVVQKQNNKILYRKHTEINWKNLPKNVRKLWSFLAVNQEYPNKLSNWTTEQIAHQYKFLLPELNNDELNLIPFDELSKMSLQDIDFDYTQARFLFSLLLENSTLKDVKLFYPTFLFKLSPLQINQFEPEEWAEEKTMISSSENIYLTYTTAKQIFNKIASNRLSSRTILINGWTSEDLRHLPLIYTQPTATSFLKFCTSPPSVQSLIAADSYMLTDRQAFYLSGCSSMLSLHNNDPKVLLGLKYMIKAFPVSSLLNTDIGNINYKVVSHLVSLVNDHNLPMALHLLNIINPGKEIYFIEEMLKNKHNILFEQLAPLDIPGPIFDVLKLLYSNYTNRIDKLPKHILNTILESEELLTKWTGNESAVTQGLYNGYTCNFIKKLNSVKFIVSISNYNAFLKQNEKVFPKNLQTCVAEAFINYLKLKSRFIADLPTSLYLEAWEIEAVQGFVLSTLPIDVILNSNLRDNILYSIGRLSYPELMVVTQPEKLLLMVDQYITHILKNKPILSYEHLYTLGNLTHFISATYLNSVDEQAFKYLVEAGLFDTRICVDSKSKEKWAGLIIKTFGNLEYWSSDTLVTLSDLLIVLSEDQLNSIPMMSRLNSADVIRTRYTDEIEWLSNNIPFYKGCKSVLGDQYVNFTNSLSTLINFHLVSMQSQLQMISPINDNHEYEKIIKSSETKPKIFKPTVLIPVPEFDNFLNILTPKKILNKFFGGKKKQDTKENIGDIITPIIEESNSSFSSSQKILISTESTSILEIKNSTTSSFLSSKNEKYEHYTESAFDVTIMPLLATDNSQKIATTSFPIKEKSEHIKHNFTSSSMDHNDIKKTHDNNKYAYDVSSNDSFSLEINEIPTVIHKTSNQNYSERNKRSLELFFISDIQISCEALKMLGPASVTAMKFNSIIHSMSDEELENCIDLLGSFNIDPELASYIWSKTKDKTALHTYGSVLSGLSIDDIRTVDLNINSPWSLELINLFSEHINDISIRKEITKLFMIKSKSNVPSHLWGSFGSLICQLQPRILRMIIPNKELFWKTSSAFIAIKTCDTPCIKNLASIAISIIGQSNLWKTAEVERMGIILSGINITQWQLLLNLNPEALEGLSPNTIKCLDEQQIKLLNETHMTFLTPKSAYTLLESHSKLLDVQKQETLFKLVNFEMMVNWQPTPVVSIPKNIGVHRKYSRESNSKANSIFVYESANDISSKEMQADSKATTIHLLYFSVFSAIVLLFIPN